MKNEQNTPARTARLAVYAAEQTLGRKESAVARAKAKLETIEEQTYTGSAPFRSAYNRAVTIRDRAAQAVQEAKAAYQAAQAIEDEACADLAGMTPRQYAASMVEYRADRAAFDFDPAAEDADSDRPLTPAALAAHADEDEAIEEWISAQPAADEDDSPVPAPVSAPYMDARRNAQRVANGARNQRDHYSHGNTPEDILIAVRDADRQLAIISPPHEWNRPTESIARWDHRGFIVLIWSRYQPGIRLNNTEKHAYRLIDTEHGADPIFEGSTFGPSPMHAWNAPESFGALIAYLTLAPGDTDPDYFDAYTPDQLAWCQGMRASELSTYGEALEMNNIIQPAETTYKLADYGTVSHGTMRDEDLIESFCSLLESLDDPRAAEYRAEYAELTARVESGDDDANDQIGYLINESLWDAMQDHAPADASFCAHPGDGSDYGYWQIDEYDA